MTIYLHRDGSQWTLHIKTAIGKPDQVHVIGSDIHPFMAIIKGLKYYYPQHRLFVDPQLSQNPFVSNHIFNTQYHGKEPDYVFIHRSIGQWMVKACRKCHGDAYYNPAINHYQCIRCKAVESHAHPSRYFRIKPAPITHPMPKLPPIDYDMAIPF